MPDPKMTKLEQLLVVQREVRAWVAEHPELRPEFTAAFARVREMFRESIEAKAAVEHRIYQSCLDLLKDHRLCAPALDQSGLAEGVEGPPVDPAGEHRRFMFHGWVSKELNEALSMQSGWYLDRRLQKLCAPWAMAAVELEGLRLRAKGLTDLSDREQASEAVYQLARRTQQLGLLPFRWTLVLERQPWQEAPRSPFQFHNEDYQALSPRDLLAVSLCRLGGLSDIGHIDPVFKNDENAHEDSATILAGMFCYPARDAGGLSPEPDPRDLDPDMAEQLLVFAMQAVREGVSLAGRGDSSGANRSKYSQYGSELPILTEGAAALLVALSVQTVAKSRACLADTLPGDRNVVGKNTKELIELKLIVDLGRGKGIAINEAGRNWVKTAMQIRKNAK